MIRDSQSLIMILNPGMLCVTWEMIFFISILRAEPGSKNPNYASLTIMAKMFTEKSLTRILGKADPLAVIGAITNSGLYQRNDLQEKVHEIVKYLPIPGIVTEFIIRKLPGLLASIELWIVDIFLGLLNSLPGGSLEVVFQAPAAGAEFIAYDPEQDDVEILSNRVAILEAELAESVTNTLTLSLAWDDLNDWQQRIHDAYTGRRNWVLSRIDYFRNKDDRYKNAKIAFQAELTFADSLFPLWEGKPEKPEITLIEEI